jgi:hypothetical protein
MARGWESKAIEDQINARDAEKRKSVEPILSHAELKRRAEKEGLLLARNHTFNLIQTSTNERYRRILELTLAHIDDQLARLDSAQQ